MSGVIATIPKYQFSDVNGAPLASGTLTTYLAGTTTLSNTWQDLALTSANTNPITLDSRGECLLWLDGTKSYKFVLKNAAGVTQWTVDDVAGVQRDLANVTGTLAIANGGTGATTAATARTALGLGTADSPTFAGLTSNGNVQMASANGGQLAGLRNKIINGNMIVAQRGTVSSGISTVTYTLDRWVVFTGGASLSVGQSAGDGASFQYALNVVGAVGNTTCNITQRIEQRNAYPLASKQVTISARIYASAAFTPTWSVDSANTADTFSATTNVATGTFSAMAIGWNDVTLTTTLNAACQNGFQVSFLMGATTSGNKGLTGVQLEVGPVATPFEQRPIGMELALCQRYFTKTYDITMAPGQANTEDNAKIGIATAANRLSTFVTFPVVMRTKPTFVFYGTSGAAGQYSLINSFANAGAISVVTNHIADNGFQEATVVGATSGTHYQFHYTASAEL